MNIEHIIYNPFNNSYEKVDIEYDVGEDEQGLFDVIINDIVTNNLVSLKTYLSFEYWDEIEQDLYDKLKS